MADRCQDAQRYATLVGLDPAGTQPAPKRVRDLGVNEARRAYLGVALTAGAVASHSFLCRRFAAL